MEETEKEKLFIQYRSGDRDAYERLIEEHLPLVKATVGRLAFNIPSYINREDLYSAGCLGLISAVERYESDREAKFTTYAITRIRGSILDELRNHDTLGRVTRERVIRIQKAEQELQHKGKDCTDEAIAKAAGLTIEEYWDAELGLAASKQISLHEELEDGEKTLSDLLAANSESEFGSTIEVTEIVALVMQLLSQKEKEFVVLYYDKGLTLKEISVIMGITESRVCQLNAEIMNRVRKKLKKKGINF